MKFDERDGDCILGLYLAAYHRNMHTCLVRGAWGVWNRLVVCCHRSCVYASWSRAERLFLGRPYKGARLSFRWLAAQVVMPRMELQMFKCRRRIHPKTVLVASCTNQVSSVGAWACRLATLILSIFQNKMFSSVTCLFVYELKLLPRFHFLHPPLSPILIMLHFSPSRLCPPLSSSSLVLPSVCPPPTLFINLRSATADVCLAFPRLSIDLRPPSPRLCQL